MRIILIILISVFMMTPQSFGDNIKEPNVSGQFYSANPATLAKHIDTFLQEASIPTALQDKDIEILISPHAGYMYSGGVAGYGYKAVSGKEYQTIVILAPSHHFGFDGISVWKDGSFKTPLGSLPIDEAFTEKLIARNEKFYFNPQVFEQEHSLEVQLPFLQKIFTDFKIVPIITGQPSYELCGELAKSLHEIVGDREDVLVVVSSDMSHFHNADFASDMDHKTIQVIENLDAENFWAKCQSRKMEMCGSVPVTTAILLARLRNLEPETLKYAHSGDVTGDMSRVVGYTSIVFYPREETRHNDLEKETRGGNQVAPLTLDQKRRLIDIAKQTIDKYVRQGKALEVNESDKRLTEAEGAFVTLHKEGQLRGCIGNIVSNAPLYLTVRNMAISAAAKDPRFQPVSPDELDEIEVEISVLSKPWRVTDVNEIEMGVHGVIVRRGFSSGVFLPQVATETGWEREEFLSYLCAHKAGLPPDAWKDPQTQIDIFTADVFSEKDVK